MTDEAQRWKEKYLKSIEQQDKLERRWNARLDLLRRGLVRSSLAAEGADKAVDACMKEMREIVRKDDMDAGLAALIPRLEKAVLESEQRREQRVEQMGTALTSLVAQLQALPLPKDVSKPLKRFAKGLEDRINQARELPLLLSELSGLQGQALSQIEHPDEASRPGFLQRLFGSHREAGSEGDDSAPLAHSVNEPAGVQVSDDAPQHSSAVPEVATENTELEAELRSTVPPVPQPVAQEPERAIPEFHPEVAVERVMSEPEPAQPDEEPEAPLHAADVPQPSAAESSHDEASEPAAEAPAPDPDETAEVIVIADDIDIPAEDDEPDETAAEEDSPYALPSSPEPSYSSVAAHIEETLLGLLDELTLPEHHRAQADAMRARLEHGLNWYELLPILDDLAVLMLAVTDSGQHEFEAYLKQLNERLESFQSGLLAASENHADQQSASRQLDHQLREHVDDLQISVQQAADLDSLKQVLERRLEGLIGTMDHHQQQRDQREQEVATRLQALSSRVATMEQEALGFRVHLEEQRQKALIDTLTGLPNRAAWNERLEQEIDQLQRKQSSLLLGILDLDHFKRINDGYGHLAGDKVLKIIAGQLRKRLRASDFIARFGGEEFVLLLPTTPLDEGLALLERLREGIEQCPFHFKGERVTVTVSMGITAFSQGERSDVVLKRADQALYRAKDEGRNRIEQG
ncbi:MAG: diguanylate cyclase [Pseudomonas sp.]|uniref:diguanylate cyclase n=1 Tax=Pseudomonas sp. TaxID=306 RepID=UPI0011FE484C|nr:diguanylate cyclase [Pseudomonas sp.]RZI75310.1 MAG: diguanylate cyclase [Pseudomonas sp.]